MHEAFDSLMWINPCHDEYFYVLHSSPIFYPVNMQLSSFKYIFTIRVENSVDPLTKPSDLDLQCYQKKQKICVQQDKGLCISS